MAKITQEDIKVGWRVEVRKDFYSPHRKMTCFVGRVIYVSYEEIAGSNFIMRLYVILDNNERLVVKSCRDKNGMKDDIVKFWPPTKTGEVLFG